MGKQTEKLASHLPGCAVLIYQAQRRSEVWQIVRSDVHFERARPEDWEPIAPFPWKGKTYHNTPTYQTTALFGAGHFAIQWAKEQFARSQTQDGRYGVYEMREGDRVFWQTVLPTLHTSDRLSNRAEIESETYVSADELDTNAVYQEGAVRQVTVNAYERNPQARRQCISHYGARCFVCGFDFGDTYGEIGEGYIHVHHLRQLADIGIRYEVNPITDLRPVCPNCHAIIHRRNPPYSVEEVQAMLRGLSA